MTFQQLFVFPIASAFPVAVFLYWIYARETVKEPIPILIRCFLGGFLAIVIINLLGPWLVINPFLKNNIAAHSIWESFYTAAIPEESAKFLVLFIFMWRSKEFNQYYDGIMYAVCVSLGFALIENLEYINRAKEDGLSTAAIRAISAVPGHGLFAVAMGYYFSLARFHEGNERMGFLAKSLLWAILLHGVYDFICIYTSRNTISSGLFLPLLSVWVFFLWRTGLKEIKAHVNRDIIKFEVPQQLIIQARFKKTKHHLVTTLISLSVLFFIINSCSDDAETVDNNNRITKEDKLYVEDSVIYGTIQFIEDLPNNKLSLKMNTNDSLLKNPFLYVYLNKKQLRCSYMMDSILYKKDISILIYNDTCNQNNLLRLSKGTTYHINRVRLSDDFFDDSTKLPDVIYHNTKDSNYYRHCELKVMEDENVSMYLQFPIGSKSYDNIVKIKEVKDKQLYCLTLLRMEFNKIMDVKIDSQFIKKE